MATDQRPILGGCGHQTASSWTLRRFATSWAGSRPGCGAWLGSLGRPRSRGCSISSAIPAAAVPIGSAPSRWSSHSTNGAVKTVFARSRVHSIDRNPFEPPGSRRREAASHAKRKRFSPRGLSKSGALTQQMSGQMCVEALCFGDFHLCQQMKVTRPPGRDPATH
jgi:hypothetical protein